MISSFEKKPANGKMPTSASVPMMNVTNVIGIFLRRPPMSFFMSKEWCEPEWLTEPAPRNRQRLEEGVGEDVEHRRRPRPDAEAHHHVAELADGGVGEHLLDVDLHERQQRGDDDRDRRR